MKSMRMLGLGLALTLAASQAHAFIDVSAFGGYSTVGMKDLNSALDAWVGSANATHVGNGFYVGADAGISVMPFLKVGPRLEYLQVGQGKVSSGGQVATVDSKLLMYELGVSYDQSLPLTGLAFQVGLWGGYGQGASVIKMTEGGTGELDGNGGAFVGELDAQLRYKLFLGLSLGVDLGYRMATLPQSLTSSTGNFAGVAGGSLVKSNGITGSDVSWDYSGLNAGLNLSWNF